MGDKHITFTDNSPGIKHVTGHAYVDEKTGDVTFTDNSAGYKHITGYGHIDSPIDSSNTTSESGVVPPSKLETIISSILFLLVCPVFVAFLLTGWTGWDYDEAIVYAFLLVLGIFIFFRVKLLGKQEEAVQQQKLEKKKAQQRLWIIVGAIFLLLIISAYVVDYITTRF